MFTENVFLSSLQVMVDVSVTLDYLQGESEPQGGPLTLGHLLPYIRNLERNIQLKLLDNTIKHTKPVLKVLLKAVQARFERFFEDKDCILAATVHPR